MDNRQWVYRYNNSLQDLCKFLMVWNCVINKNCVVWASASSQFLFMLLAVTKHFRTYRIRSLVVISIHLSGCANISGFFTILFSHYFYCFLIYKHPQICYYFERSEIIVFAEYKQTQRTREYICWPHYREFPEGNLRFPWLRGKCRCRWKMAWERCSRDEIYIQTATGPPVTAEGYQDSDRSSQKWLECQTGIAPDEVSDREAGTNRSGNTGRTRLLYINREGVFLYSGFQRLKCCSCLHDNP